MPDNQKQRCFVVMGFQKKTDLATGRLLDLDASYEALIKPAVEAEGLECVRANEILHSGIIDAPMYRELLTADVVIADLSTSNANALYELGVRHALRPRTTIVIAENGFAFPFDLSHVTIAKYEHLGTDIGFRETQRFQGVLRERIRAVLKVTDADSPVYTFLSLVPPALKDEFKVQAAVVAAATAPIRAAIQEEQAEHPADPVFSQLVQDGDQAIAAGGFAKGRDLLKAAMQLAKPRPDGRPGVQDTYLIQRLALATYKAKDQDELTRLTDAVAILKPCNPSETNDPETVGLAGAIEKRLYEKLAKAEHLNNAIWYYGRGFYLRSNAYNGINLAFLLSMRAASPIFASSQDKIADLIWANRLREQVLGICQDDLKSLQAAKAQAQEAISAGTYRLRSVQEQTFWCYATMAEANFGLGRIENFKTNRADALKMDRAEVLKGSATDWMRETFEGQIAKLKALLDAQGQLLDPPWPREDAARALSSA